MKKTDLRIGNLAGIKETALHADGCNHSEAVFEIEEIKKDVVQFKGYHANEYYKDLNPIPLTEQWLLDFGFEKYTGRYGVYYKHYALDGFRVWLPRDIYGWGYTVGRKDFETGDTYWVKNEVRYVHQLQNIYFALTQEELIIK